MRGRERGDLIKIVSKAEVVYMSGFTSVFIKVYLLLPETLSKFFLLI